MHNYSIIYTSYQIKLSELDKAQYKITFMTMTTREVLYKREGSI